MHSILKPLQCLPQTGWFVDEQQPAYWHAWTSIALVTHGWHGSEGSSYLTFKWLQTRWGSWCCIITVVSSHMSSAGLKWGPRDWLSGSPLSPGSMPPKEEETTTPIIPCFCHSEWDDSHLSPTDYLITVPTSWRNGNGSRHYDSKYDSSENQIRHSAISRNYSPRCIQPNQPQRSPTDPLWTS